MSLRPRPPPRPRTVEQTLRLWPVTTTLDISAPKRSLHPPYRPPLTNATIRKAVTRVLNLAPPYVHEEYGPIAEWDVSEVTDMSWMFHKATTFQGDLSRWNVSKVDDMGGMFYYATSFNSDLSRWNVSKVETMVSMFEGATNFNSDLSRWNVSKVQFIYNMFKGAASFNSDLSRWNVSKVELMDEMFLGATSFDSDLSRWKMPKVRRMMGVFDGAKAYNPRRALGSQATYPAPRVHGEPENLFDRTQFPPLPDKLPPLPKLATLPDLT